VLPIPGGNSVEVFLALLAPLGEGTAGVTDGKGVKLMMVTTTPAYPAELIHKGA